MSRRTDEKPVFAPAMAWLGALLVPALVVAASITYTHSEATDTAGGSPLYGKAVHEAVEGLVNVGAKPAAARPPLPAGLSPNDYYWCEKCQSYHKRQSEPAPAAGTTPSPAAGASPATPAAQPAALIPPLPAGLSPADYYWCPNCKAYHPRQPAPVVPPAAATPPAAAEKPVKPE